MTPLRESPLELDSTGRIRSLLVFPTFRSVPDRSLCLEFSGSQPESCELASQFVPFCPIANIRSKSAIVSARHSASGLQLSVLPAPSGKPLMVGR